MQVGLLYSFYGFSSSSARFDSKKSLGTCYLVVIVFMGCFLSANGALPNGDTKGWQQVLLLILFLTFFLLVLHFYSQSFLTQD